MKRNASIIKQAKSRDGCCLKCGKTSDLQGHHVKALCDNGSDSIDNIATLCGHCHIDWEYVSRFVDGIVFTEWLDIPQATILVQLWRTAPEQVSFGEIKRSLLSLVYSTRLIRRPD